MSTVEANFDWNEAKEGDLIAVRPQLAIAIYYNTDGDVVIRRQAEPYLETEDVFIVIPRENAGDIARRIVNAAKESGDV